MPHAPRPAKCGFGKCFNFRHRKLPFLDLSYPSLMLLKGILLQKWFSIKSELENQFNNRISFKIFIELPLADHSPDHSIICRFRGYVGKGHIGRDSS